MTEDNEPESGTNSRGRDNAAIIGGLAQGFAAGEWVGMGVWMGIVFFRRVLERRLRVLASATAARVSLRNFMRALRVDGGRSGLALWCRWVGQEGHGETMEVPPASTESARDSGV